MQTRRDRRPTPKEQGESQNPHPRKRRVRHPLLQTKQNEEKMNQETAVIVNLTEQSWILHRSYGVFAVSTCVPGEPYGLTRVTSRTALMDLGDKRTLDVRITAREVAEDLC